MKLFIVFLLLLLTGCISHECKEAKAKAHALLEKGQVTNTSIDMEIAFAAVAYELDVCYKDIK